MNLVRELKLTDAKGVPLTGYDPEGISINPEGGYVLVSEGVAGNGSTTACVGTATSNRILFFDANGRLNPAYGSGGIVDFPWRLGHELVRLVEGHGQRLRRPRGRRQHAQCVGRAQDLRRRSSAPSRETNTRIGEYDVDTRKWNFHLPARHRPGWRGWQDLPRASFSTSAAIASPSSSVTRAGRRCHEQDHPDVLAQQRHQERRHQAGRQVTGVRPLEGLVPLRPGEDRGPRARRRFALGRRTTTTAARRSEFFMRLDPSVLAAPTKAPEVVPNVVINEVNSNLTPNDLVELPQQGATPRTSAAGPSPGLRRRREDRFPLGPRFRRTAIYLVNLVSNVDFGLGKADSVTVATSRGN